MSGVYIYLGFAATVLVLCLFFLPKIKRIIVERDDEPQPWSVCDNCAKTIWIMDTVRICTWCHVTLCSEWCNARHRDQRESFHNEKRKSVRV